MKVASGFKPALARVIYECRAGVEKRPPRGAESEPRGRRIMFPAGPEHQKPSKATPKHPKGGVEGGSLQKAVFNVVSVPPRDPWPPLIDSKCRS